MKLKSKILLFCGDITEFSKILIKSFLDHNVKSIIIANTNEESLQQLEVSETLRSKLSYCKGDLTKIEDLEGIFSQVLKESKQKVQLVVNYKEINANDSWEDLITIHINSLICGSLMAMKHLGSMNSGRGGTVLNALTIFGRNDPEYISIHRLLNDLDRSFSDPYYFNNTAVRILTMCARVTMDQELDLEEETSFATCSSTTSPKIPPVKVKPNVTTETITLTIEPDVQSSEAAEDRNPIGSANSVSVSVLHEKFQALLEKLHEIFASMESYLQPPPQHEQCKEFEISEADSTSV